MMTFGKGGGLWRQLSRAGFRLDPSCNGGQFLGQENTGLIGTDRNEAADPLSIVSFLTREAKTMAVTAFGLRQAVDVVPVPVDLSTIRFDPDRQISLITEGGVSVPALKHSTGTTSTNTAAQDNKGGADRDSDQTED